MEVATLPVRTTLTQLDQPSLGGVLAWGAAPSEVPRVGSASTVGLNLGSCPRIPCMLTLTQRFAGLKAP